MRIQIIGDESISRQARTYAEYRLFAALSEAVDTRRIESALLVLRHASHHANGSQIDCAVTIETDSGDAVRIKTTGEHPYAAINRAIERVGACSWPPAIARQRVGRASVK